MNIKGTKRTKVSALEMYSKMIYDRLTKGTADRIETLGSDKIHIGYKRITTDATTRVFFYIKSMPEYVPNSLFQDIREYVTLEGIRVNFMADYSPQTIKWESTEMRDMQHAWEQMLAESAEEDGKFLQTLKSTLKTERERRLIRSWKYISDADKQHFALVSSNCIIEIRTLNNTPDYLANLEPAEERLIRYFSQNQIELGAIKGFMLDFLQYSSPLMDETETISGNLIPARMLTDEIISNMTSYTPGKLEQTEIILGVDVLTNMMVYMDLKNIQKDSLNILLAASTSSGKSTFAKCLAREIIAVRKNFIVIDRDNEYSALTRRVGGTIINLSKQFGKYFDPVQIGDLTGMPEIDAGLFSDSILATTTIFNTLTRYSKGMNTSESKIYNDAYNLVLARAGVMKDSPTTWVNSTKLRLHDIYYAIVELSQNSRYLERYGNVIKDFVDKLSMFFEPTGLRSHLFKDKISIRDILRAKKNGAGMMLDICLYLDADTDKTEEGLVEQSIKFITANYLTVLLVNYFKSLEESTIVGIEEYQRYMTEDDMQTLVLNMITGNRKRNAGTLLITNSPGEILRGGNATTIALTSNIKNLIIGRIDNVTVVHDLCAAWNIPYCEQTMLDIASDPVTYKHCFLTRLDGGEIAVVKQPLPLSLQKSPEFTTSK